MAIQVVLQSSNITYASVDVFNLRAAWENLKSDWISADCSTEEINSLSAEYGLQLPYDEESD